MRERLHGTNATLHQLGVVTERRGCVQLAGKVMTQAVMSQNLMLHNQLQELSRPSAAAVRSLACRCRLLLLLGRMRLLAGASVASGKESTRVPCATCVLERCRCACGEAERLRCTLIYVW